MAKPKRAARATPKFATLDASSEATTTQSEVRATPSGTSRSDQPDAQHRPRRPRFTEDEVAEALKAAGGIFSGAAARLASARPILKLTGRTCENTCAVGVPPSGEGATRRKPVGGP